MSDQSNEKNVNSSQSFSDGKKHDAQAELDAFTVLQDVEGGNLDNKAYEIDNVSTGEEEAVAANPLMGIRNQDFSDDALQNEPTDLSKNIIVSDNQIDQSGASSAAAGEPLDTLSSGIIETSNGAISNTDIQTDGVRGQNIQNDALDTLNGSGAEALQEDLTIEAEIITQPSAQPIIQINDTQRTSNKGAGDDNEGLDDALPDLEFEPDTETDLDLQPDPETEPQPLTPNVKVRLSNATDGQDTINSIDGHDLVIFEYGVPYTITGKDMDISGVRENAQVTYIFHDENTVEVTLDTAWNSVKNIEVSSDTAGNVTFNNFVHTDVNLGDGGNSAVIINGAKRGNINTGDGDDRIEVNADTNGTGWGNDFNINTGAGADVIDVIGDQGATGFNIDAGDDNDIVTVGGVYDGTTINLGGGDDIFTGGDGNDIVFGGDGNDTITSGGGNDVLNGGGGKDTFVIKAGDGTVIIADFGGVGGGGRGEAALMPKHDTIKLDGDGLTAENMLLEYDGQNTIVTFEGVENFQISLENFDFTDLDNLSGIEGWNIIFDGQSEGTDAYDVFNDHGSSMDGIWNKNSVTHLNEADNIVKGKDGSNDVINAMEGNDTISGGTGNDVLRGQAGNDTLYGDDPNDVGSSYVTTTINVSFVSSNAGYKNSIGAYAVDKDGNILGIDVGVENAKAASSGDTFQLEVSGPEASGVGYFIISNGYSKNKSFFDAYDFADGTYSFLYKAGTGDERPANIADDPNDISLVFDTGTQIITLKGDVYHSNAGLNTDGKDHVTFASNTNGSTRLGFEDLKNLGDADFNDVVLDVSVANETIYELPQKQGGDDRLVGGEGDDRLIGQGGNDRLEGGAGDDTAVFTGFREEYDITFNNDGSITITDTVSGRDGTDTLTTVEFVEFRDGVIEATPEALILPAATVESSTYDDVIVEENNGDTGNENNEVVDDQNETSDTLDQNEDQDQPEEMQDYSNTNDGNNGHGNDADGVDNSNPGQGKGGPNSAEDQDLTLDTDINVADQDIVDTDVNITVDPVEDTAGDIGAELGADANVVVDVYDTKSNNGNGKDKSTKDNKSKDKGEDGNNGHGNDVDGVDNSNPGQGKGGPNAGKNDDGDIEFFALNNEDQDDGGQSWLAEIETATDNTVFSFDQNTQSNNWIDDVENTQGDKNGNNGKAKANGKNDTEDRHLDIDDGQIVDIGDIMPDMVAQNTTDVSGGIL